MKPPVIFSRDTPFICRLEFFVLCLIFLTHRIGFGTFFNLISDCDEVFNYWEPVHFVSSLPFGSTTRLHSTLSLTNTTTQSLDGSQTHDGHYSGGRSIAGIVHNHGGPKNPSVNSSTVKDQQLNNGSVDDQHKDDLNNTLKQNPHNRHPYYNHSGNTDIHLNETNQLNIESEDDESLHEPHQQPSNRRQLFGIGNESDFGWSMKNNNDTTNDSLLSSSMQTWEYSPNYALRSYLYILSHSVLVWLSQFFHWLCLDSISSLVSTIPDNVQIFFMTRGFLSLIAALIELQFARSLKPVFGRRVATLYLLINLLSPGTFLAANQMLPSTSFMLITLLSFSHFLKYRFSFSLLFAVIGTIVCWPFAGVIYVPLGLIALRRFGIALTLGTLVQSIIVVLATVIGVDYIYYGKFVITPLNIVLYNFGFGQGGGGAGKSILYGVESWTFYIRNLLLNFNVFLILGGLGLLIMLGDMFRSRRSSSTTTTYSSHRGTAGIKESMFVIGTPIPLWGGLMTLLPHKEERFLTIIYPMLCLSSAIALDWFIGRAHWHSHFDPLNDHDEEAGISKKHDDWKTTATTTTSPNSPNNSNGQHATSSDATPTNRFGLLSFAFFRRKSPQAQPQSSAHLPEIPSFTEISARKSSTMKSPRRFLWFLFWVSIASLNASRLLALYHYYWNPIISIWTTAAGLTPLAKPIATSSSHSNKTGPMMICTGTDWYRYPSSFFLPQSSQLGFVASGFTGLLPGVFQDTRDKSIAEHMNDDNREEPSHYTSLQDCDYLIDSSSEPFEYMPRQTLLLLNHASLTQPPHASHNTLIISPHYIKRRINVVRCTSLLDNQRSRFPYRSFFVGDVLSKRATTNTNYCLWKLTAY